MIIDVNKLSKIDTATSKRKVVTRKWNTKNGVKSKSYVYAESPLLFTKTKTGYKLNPSEWNKFEAAIRKEYGRGATANSIINNARRIRNDILNTKNSNASVLSSSKTAKYGGKKQYASALQKGWNRIDIKSMISRLAASAAEKYILNMGLTPADIIAYVKQVTGKDIDETELLNPGNWNTDTWIGKATDGAQIKLIIRFSYSGVSNIKVNIV